MLPFSRPEFFTVFADYNTAVWPLQILFWLLGLVAVLALVAGWRRRGPLIAAILSVFWCVMALGYHWLFFSQVNTAAYAFGGLFAVAAVLFLLEGVIHRRTVFERQGGLHGKLAIVLLGYALLVYPAVGLLWLHPYPETPLFGVAPCPTTIFTLGMLLLARARSPLMLASIPLIWAAVGGSAAVLLQVPQDWGLIAAGIAWIVVYKAQPARRRLAN